MSSPRLVDNQRLPFASNLSWSPSAVSLARSLIDRAGDGVSCRLGDASCASAHANGISRSAGGKLHRALLKLQRNYGNRFVDQVLRKSRGETQEDGMEEIERSIDGARGGGQGLDHRTRGQMESAFGADFSGVRVHHDNRSNVLSEALGARAFATGRDIFFRQGEYDTGSSVGRELLAHELTHVVQQNGGDIRRKMTVSDPSDPQELEADQMARRVMEDENREGALGRQPEAVTEEDEKAPGAPR